MINGAARAADTDVDCGLKQPRTIDDPASACSAQLVVDGSALAAMAPGAPPAGTGVVPARANWLRRYRGWLLVIDAASALVGIVVGLMVRFGPSDGAAAGSDNLVFCLALPVAWVLAVGLNGGYEARIIGSGPTEFGRVLRAISHLALLIPFLSYVVQAELSRGLVVMVVLAALGLDLEARYLARKLLHRRRAHGQSLRSVLAIGDPAAVVEFTTLLMRDRRAGLRVVGACVPADMVVDDCEAHATLADQGVRLLGGVDTVVESVRRSGANVVAVLGGGLRPEKLRWISWQLEGADVDLIVSPGLTEVGGRRLHIQPVAGLPLLHIDEPQFSGFRRMLKGGFDRSVALAALLVLAPLLAALALAVRATSSGPAFFRQVRVGVGGQHFRVYKFRSMCVDAEARLDELTAQNENDGVLFKMKCDPRITTVGALLRKLSLDELPQLLNVVKGDMSLVGPRPPLPSEVACYADHVTRRLLVKPGITGLWQISGRSDLSWDESVRLDLHYVENWSLGLDLVILWKTLFAVVRGSGAY